MLAPRNPDATTTEKRKKDEKNNPLAAKPASCASEFSRDMQSCFV